MDDALVLAVAADNTRRIEARIDGDLVQGAEVVRLFLATEGLEVFSGLVEDMDVAARVAVSDVKIAVRGDVHRGQANDGFAFLVLVLEFVGDGGGGNVQELL